MTQYGEKLSAFLDGELADDEAREIEQALEQDPTLQAELEELMEADVLAKHEFAEMLDEPVPFELASAIRQASVVEPANDTGAPSRFAGWFAATAAVVALAMTGVGGYYVGSSQTTQVAGAPGWLDDIADYHAVYAAQTRHLVEVPAAEADHIETWLTATVGTDVRIPDLSSSGLTFEGARLLVAAGKPVAQLIFTDADQRVVALCAISTDTPRDGFAEQTINSFQMVSWGGSNANFVIVGDEGRGDLQDIAEDAAVQI